MTVKPKYYFNLDGNISDGEKEYSLENIEDKIGGLSISSDLKDNYVLYGRNSLLKLINNFNDENEQLKDENKELKEENKQLKQAKKFFEEILFNVIYATSDYQRLLLNKEMLEVIDECKSLDELREKANYGIEEFKEEHKWLE